MWNFTYPDSDTTNTFITPTDGIISVTKPDSITVFPYVNDVVSAVHHVHVKAGDQVYFKITNSETTPVEVAFDYAGMTNTILVPAGGDIKPTSTESAYTKEDIMTPAETINLFANPGMGNSGMGAGAGAGLGAGLVGGLLGGQLFGNDRNRNNVNDINVVTPALLASSLAQVTDTAQSTTILQTLGDIKASIPLAEGQVQLALAGSQADINGNINLAVQSNMVGQAAITSRISDSLGVAIAGQAGINKNISDSLATAIAGQGVIRDTVLTTGAALGAAINQNRYDVTTAVRDDGDRTRALIVSQNDAMLNRELAVAQAALLEQRAIGRSRDVEVNVTQSVTQNQNNLQQQSQSQQQFQILANLAAQVGNLAGDIQAVRQTQSNVNFGVQGTAGQTASAANTRVN